MKYKKTNKFAFYGMLFGLSFPLTAMAMIFHKEQLVINFENFVSLQTSNYLLWIIDSAPLFLGLFSGYAGRMMDQVIEKNHEIENVARFPKENPNVVLRVDHDGKIIFANDSAKKIFFRSKKKTEYSIPKELMDCVRQCLHQDRIIVEQQEVGKRTYSWTCVSISVHAYVNIYGVDITEKILAQNKLNEKAQELEHAKRLSVVGEFAAGIAHEVNNPLAIIHAKTQLLELYVSQISIGNIEKLELIQGAMDSIKETVMHTSDLIKNLQSFSSKRDFQNVKITQIADVIDIVLNISRSRCLNQGIDVVIDAEEDVQLLCSPSVLSQVILNLMLNSIDAVEKLDQKWIRIETVTSGNCLKIFVTDSGKGIDPEIINKLMHPFFTTKDPGKGTGLGLPIALKSIEKMNGKFYYNSEAENTQFVIEFPNFKSRV